MASSQQGPAVAIAGMGEGFGLSLAKAFSAAGYDVIGLSRSGRCDNAAAALTAAHGRAYVPLTCDVTDDGAVAAILAPHAPRIEVAIYNAHHLVIAPFLETAAGDFAQAMAINWGGAGRDERAPLLPGDACARAGHIDHDRRHRGDARQRQLCRPCVVEIRAPRIGAVAGAGIWTERDSRRACCRGWLDRRAANASAIF